MNKVKYMHQEAWTGGKEYIVSALFKYLDLDDNGLLTVEELNKVRLPFIPLPATYQILEKVIKRKLNVMFRLFRWRSERICIAFRINVI